MFRAIKIIFFLVFSFLFIPVNFLESALTFDDGWSCGDVLVDERDGQTYKTALIGDTCWMTENLNFGKRLDAGNYQGDSCLSLQVAELLIEDQNGNLVNVPFEPSAEQTQKLYDIDLKVTKRQFKIGFIDYADNPFSGEINNIGRLIVNENHTLNYPSIVTINSEGYLVFNLDLNFQAESLRFDFDLDRIFKYCYNDNEANCDIYGGLYQWNQLMCGQNNPNSQGICPSGWNIPSEYDFQKLYEAAPEHYHEAVDYDGYSLKNTTWDGTNITEFSALPGGRWSSAPFFGGFSEIDNQSSFFTSTENCELSPPVYILGDGQVSHSIVQYSQDSFDTACWFVLFRESPSRQAGPVLKNFANSVRCISDQEQEEEEVQLEAPIFFFLQPETLVGGDNASVRFLFSSDDSRAEGEIDGISYITEFRYFNNEDWTDWNDVGAMYEDFSSYYRINFEISDNNDDKKVQFRSKATHSNLLYLDSEWVQSEQRDLNHYYFPINSSGFISPVDYIYGGENVIVSWQPTSDWGNPSQNKNYRLEISYNNGDYQLLANTGEVVEYNYYLENNKDLENVRYMLIAETNTGFSDPIYSEIIDIIHPIPNIFDLTVSDFAPQEYCSKSTPLPITLFWKYDSLTGHNFINSEIQVKKDNVDFSNDILINISDLDALNYTIDRDAFGDNINFGENYYWRARVKNENGYYSDWGYFEFRTGEKRAIVDFSWDPLSPIGMQNVQFGSNSVEGDLDIISNNWMIESGDPSFGSGETFTSRFLNSGLKTVKLEVIDSEGIVCSLEKNINVREILSEDSPSWRWREIFPW